MRRIRWGLGVMVWLLGMQSLYASDYSIDSWDITLDIPSQWTGEFLNDSTYIVNHPNGNLLFGVAYFSSLSPYTSESEWVSGNALGSLILLESEPAVIWSTDSINTTQGLFTYTINYETFYQETGDVMAGQSRFVANNGKGYEFFILGDTTELYYNYAYYDSIMSLIRFDQVTALRDPLASHAPQWQALGSQRWMIQGLYRPGEVQVFDLQGKRVAVHLDWQSGNTLLTLSTDLYGAPVFLRYRGQSWLLDPLESF